MEERDDSSIDPFANNEFAAGDVSDVERTYGDDGVDLSIPATPEEADATRASWQDDQDETFPLLDDPIEEKRKKLGFSLAWWGDLSLLHGLDEIMSVVDSVSTQQARAAALIAHGVDRDAMAVQGPPLGIVNGPLVMGGLQLLGMFAPHLRDEIERLLSEIPHPQRTEEETEQIKAAAREIAEEAAEALREALRERGDTTTRVVSTKDELFEALDEIADQSEEPGAGSSRN